MKLITIFATRILYNLIQNNMKQTILFLCIIALSIANCADASAMSKSKIRRNAHFLTDRMAHELRLSRGQYDDIYEINYDFINDIRYVVDDAMRGYAWALDRYYEALDYRNDDLRWVLNRDQYRRFMRIEHFYRPICAQHGKWVFRVHIKYHNHSHFYFKKPHHYRSYSGGHCHAKRNNRHHYKNRYKHKTYSSSDYRTSRREVSSRNRKSDFGITETRPGSERQSSGRSSSGRSTEGRSSSAGRSSSDRSSSVNSAGRSSSDRKSSSTRSTTTPTKSDKSTSVRSSDKSSRSESGSSSSRGSSSRRSSSND